MPDQNPAAILALSDYAQKLGIRHVETTKDRAVYALPFAADNVTVADVVHGGAILSLADIAATGAAWSTVTDPADHQGLTINLSHGFMNAARGTGLIAEAQVLRRGGTVCFIQVDIRTEHGEPVARTEVVYKLSRRSSPAETLTGLFRGKSVSEQMQLLGTLEQAGGGLYRQWAEHEGDAVRRSALIAAAEREDENAALLEWLTEASR